MLFRSTERRGFNRLVVLNVNDCGARTFSIVKRSYLDTQGNPADVEAVQTHARMNSSAGSIDDYVLTAGIQLAASVVLMLFVGRWADGKFGTTPWLMLAGMFFGLAAGLFQFLRTVNAVSRREAEEKSRHEH